MLFRLFRAKGAACPAQQHSATCYIYLVKGKNVVALVAAYLGYDRCSWSLPITRTTPAKQHTCLHNSVVKWVCVQNVSAVQRVL